MDIHLFGTREGFIHLFGTDFITAPPKPRTTQVPRRSTLCSTTTLVTSYATLSAESSPTV